MWQVCPMKGAGVVEQMDSEGREQQRGTGKAGCDCRSTGASKRALTDA